MSGSTSPGSKAGGTPADRGRIDGQLSRGSRARWVADILLGLALLVIVFVGWRETLFSTDDAYIAFRYVSNAMEGRGLVWNPAPFLPVEGYTSFSWVMLLWGVWAFIGVEPPDAANVLGLMFGYGTLALGWRMLHRMALPAELATHRRWLIAIALLSIAANRVFLTWLSSGLETSLFVFSLTWWVSVATARQRGDPLPDGVPAAHDDRVVGRASHLAMAATLTALTRPDGLLVVAATCALVALRPGRRRRWLGLWPLVIVVGHVLWRRSFYGEWLPNTYYAKYVTSWPEAGWRYAMSYVVENGAWAWLLLACAFALTMVRRLGWSCLLATWRNLGAVAAVGVVLTHGAYYTMVIGGDYFEYRVFAHLPLLLVVSAAWMAAHTLRLPAAALGALGLVGLAPLPLSWLEWQVRQPLAPHVPAFTRPVVESLDTWQKWLHGHFVCSRQQALKHATASFTAHYGTRAEGCKIAWDDRPVCIGAAIGVLSWVLPHVAIIDSLGLTDWVIARNPAVPPSGVGQALLAMFDRFDTNGDGIFDVVEQRAAAAGPLRIPGVSEDATVRRLQSTFGLGEGVDIKRQTAHWMALDLDNRKMAHERSAPEGYFDGFRANVTCVDKQFLVNRRLIPLTDEEIRAHEAAQRARFRK